MNPNICHPQSTRNWKRIVGEFLLEKENLQVRECFKSEHKVKPIKMCIAPSLPLALFCSVAFGIILFCHGTTTPISVIRTSTEPNQSPSPFSFCMPVLVSDFIVYCVKCKCSSTIALWSKYTCTCTAITIYPKPRDKVALFPLMLSAYLFLCRHYTRLCTVS